MTTMYKVSVSLASVVALALCGCGKSDRSSSTSTSTAEPAGRAAAAAPAARTAKDHYETGVAHWQAGRPGATLDEFLAALKLDPDYEEALTGYLAIAGKLGLDMDAVRVLQNLAAAHPDSYRLHYHLGRQMGLLGEAKGALLALERAIALKPDYAPAYHFMAVVYNLETAPEAAMKAARKASELDPENAEYQRLLGQLHSDQGLFEEADAILKKALAADATQPGAYYSLALNAMRRGELEAAVRGFRDTISLDPKHLQAHLNLANALYRSGDIEAGDEAKRQHDELEAYEKEMMGYHSSVLQAPGEVGPLLALAAFHEKAKEPQRALMVYLHALDIDPNNSEAHYHAGRLLVQKQLPGEALEHLRQVEAGTAHYDAARALLADLDG